jgi:polyisoprenoid-binding protein YceI
MRRLTLIIALVGFAFAANSQKMMTRTGKITFFSEASLENIEAVNNQVSSVINADNGDVAFSLLMKAFSFEKALMQEHFNEKYVESDKFPKATFKGTIQNYSSLKLSEKPTEVTVKGTLTIHGVAKEVTYKGTLAKMSDGKLNAVSDFTIKLDDYKIAIPSAVQENISNTIKISVNMTYEAM